MGILGKAHKKEERKKKKKGLIEFAFRELKIPILIFLRETVLESNLLKETGKQT